MKFDQFVILVLFALVVAYAIKVIAEAFDQIEFTYDPETGRQDLKLSKSSQPLALPPRIIEGN